MAITSPITANQAMTIEMRFQARMSREPQRGDEEREAAGSTEEHAGDRHEREPADEQLVGCFGAGVRAAIGQASCAEDQYHDERSGRQETQRLTGLRVEDVLPSQHAVVARWN